MHRLLITGGAGFIGINSARYFLAKGWHVTICDNFSRKGTEDNVGTLLKEFPKVVVVRGDVRKDIELIAQEVARHDYVLHLAAQVAVTTSIADPRNDIEQNILGTFNVLEAIRMSANKPALIYTSTNKVYGALERYPVRERLMRYEFEDDERQKYGIPETQSLDFHSPYGCSKGAADQYVIDYARIYGLKTLVLRQSCIYGEHQFGIEDQGWVAWLTIAAMLGKPITIYGTGKQVRDILFAGDLVRLYDIAFQHIDRISGRAYNVGGGPQNTLSLLELVYHLGARFGYGVRPGYGPVRAGDQPIFVADIRALERDLDWKPEVGVEEGISRMHAWLAANRASIERTLSS